MHFPPFYSITVSESVRTITITITTTLFPGATVVAYPVLSEPQKSNTGIIVGGAIGGLAILTAIVLFTLWFRRRNARDNAEIAPFTVGSPTRSSGGQFLQDPPSETAVSVSPYLKHQNQGGIPGTSGGYMTQHYGSTGGPGMYNMAPSPPHSPPPGMYAQYVADMASPTQHYGYTGGPSSPTGLYNVAPSPPHSPPPGAGMHARYSTDTSSPSFYVVQEQGPAGGVLPADLAYAHDQRRQRDDETASSPSFPSTGSAYGGVVETNASDKSAKERESFARPDSGRTERPDSAVAALSPRPSASSSGVDSIRGGSMRYSSDTSGGWDASEAPRSSTVLRHIDGGRVEMPQVLEEIPPSYASINEGQGQGQGRGN
jgi:hypothetical protein